MYNRLLLESFLKLLRWFLLVFGIFRRLGQEPMADVMDTRTIELKDDAVVLLKQVRATRDLSDMPWRTSFYPGKNLLICSALK